MLHFILLLLPVLAFTADLRNDLDRRQKLKRSAESWFQREVAPELLQKGYLVRIREVSVFVEEEENVLPPDLGGPLPGSPLPVDAQIFILATQEDHRWGEVGVECRIYQRLLAKNNGKGRPERILPNQPFRAPLACARR